MFLEKKLKANLGVRYYLHLFSQLLGGARCYLKIVEAIICFQGVIEGCFSPRSLILWSSQHCSPYHQFDLVYDILIPQRYQCIFLLG